MQSVHVNVYLNRLHEISIFFIENKTLHVFKQRYEFIVRKTWAILYTINVIFFTAIKTMFNITVKLIVQF